MRQLVRQRQGLVEAGQGLLRVPQQPEGHSGMGSAANTRILEPMRNTGARRWSGVERAMPSSRCRRAAGNAPKQKPRHPEGIVGDDRERGVIGTLRQAQQGFADLSRRVQL